MHDSSGILDRIYLRKDEVRKWESLVKCKLKDVCSFE